MSKQRRINKDNSIMSKDSITSIKEHITIEEAIKRGLWRIVNQLEKDKRARQGLGLKSLEESINIPRRKKLGRPKIYK